MIIFLAGFNTEEVAEKMRYKVGNVYAPAIEYLARYNVYEDFVAGNNKIPLMPFVKNNQEFFSKYYKSALRYLMKFLPYKFEDNHVYPNINSRKLLTPFVHLMFVLPEKYQVLTPEQNYLFNKAKEVVIPGGNGVYYYGDN